MSSTTLYFKEGSSDKIYQAAIEQQTTGYVVRFAYGRRGSTLSTGTKTPSPISFDNAKRIFDKLVKSKMAKGYTTGADSMAYSDGSRRMTDIRPQLLNSTEDVEALLADKSFLLQPKHDGKRLLIHKRGQEVTGINRRGIECGIPESISSAALSLPGNFLLDGEAVGETLHAFDILELEGTCIRQTPYRARLIRLLHLLGKTQQMHIQWVATVSGETSKRRFFHGLQQEQAEGVVFKKIDAPYLSGRPGSGGDQLKYKFVETASVIVTCINAKRSVSIGVWDNGRLVPAGNVTIPPDHSIPQVGDTVEIRYLYAHLASGSLYQPVYLGVRDDIAAAECTRDQLKFRKEPEEVAA